MPIVQPRGETNPDLPGAVQVIDSLITGGAEKVAVDLANSLPPQQWRSWICSTRSTGPLASAILPHAGQIHLSRRGTFDLGAISAFARFLRQERISIIHAHSTSLFFSTAAAILAGRGEVIWHDHYGRFGIEIRNPRPYRIAFWKARAAIGVTEQLTQWARSELGLSEARARYIPNFAVEPPPVEPVTGLPGVDGKRIVMVGNLRRQKNHPFVIETMKLVLENEPGAMLFFVGTSADTAYNESLAALRDSLGLTEHIHFLGHRPDIHPILRACDLAILGSASEGLPIALLEYGMAARASIATDVGQCREVLADGECGVLVPSGVREPFAAAIVDLLRSPEKRGILGPRLYNRVQKQYSQGAVIRQVTALYESVLGRQSLR